MVATGAGVLFAIAPWVGLIAAIVWFGLFLLTRYVSVASVVSALIVPVVALALGYPAPVIAFCTIGMVGVIVLHRGNHRRLRAGTERRARLRRTAQV
jgi:glycerol-3-phosphate acyltransferase PlsY